MSERERQNPVPDARKSGGMVSGPAPDVQARVTEVLDEHADCLVGATVDQDAAIHYPCGIVVRPPIFGLSKSNRAHVATALAEADLLAKPCPGPHLVPAPADDSEEW